MKKLSKKWFALLMALTMIVSLAACGKKTDTTSTKNSATDGAAKATATPTAKPDIYPAFDFGKRNIKVGIWWDYFYTSKHKSINDNPNVTNTETAQMMLDNVRRIEKKYNCTIEFVNLGWQGTIDSINTSVTAGTPECDIYLTDLQFGLPAVINGLAQNLETIVPKNFDLFTTKKITKPLTALGGAYLFTEQAPAMSGTFLGYNATMIKELGLEDPQELYKQGKWTWDKFAEYAKKGTKDKDNDGTTDVYGYGGIFTNLVDGLVLNNGGTIAAEKKEGLSSKPVTEALEFMNKLYNVDKSARPWNGDDWNDNLLAWSDGKVMFWTAQAWSLKQEADAAIKDGSELPFEYHIVPYPAGPSGDGKIYSQYSGNWYILPVGVKEPEKVYQVFEEFLNWHKGDPELRDDPSWFESCFPSEADVQLAYKCGENQKLDPWGSLSPAYDFGSTIWWPVVVNKDTTVAQAVEAAKPVVQDALDNFWNK